MSTGGGTQPVVTQTQNTSPWGGAQPYLSDIYAKAQYLQNTGSGYTPYSGPVVAGLDPQFAQTMQNLYGLTNEQISQFGGGVPGVQAATDLGTQLIGSQGMNATTNMGLGTLGLGLNTLSSALGTTSQAGGQFQNLYNQNINQTNPYLLQSIADQERLATDRIQSSFSGAGRYGSGQYADIMARAQAEVADPLLAQDYAQRMQIAQAASQGLAGIAGLQQGIAGAQAGIGQQQANIGFQGLNQAGQWAQLLPQLWQQQMQTEYMPYQMQMGLGQFAQDRAQQELQGNISLYNAQQAADWQNLQRYAAILAGAGSLGGSTVTAQTPQQAPLAQRLLGGALVGGGLGSAFGPIGTGAGALGGGLLGGFL